MVDHTNDIFSPYKSVETTFLFSNLYYPLQHAATFVFNSFSCGKWCYHHILEHPATSKPMAYVLCVSEAFDLCEVSQKRTCELHQLLIVFT